MSDDQPIPPEHAEIDAQLDQWGRWSQRRRGGWKSACGSAEGHYRAPWRQWHYPTTEEMMPPANAREMLAIDRAIVRLPQPYLQLVRDHYHARLTPRKIRRRLGIHVSVWHEHLYRARQMVINILRSGLDSTRDLAIMRALLSKQTPCRNRQGELSPGT